MSSLIKKVSSGAEDSIDLSDVTCPICLTLMMEPVRLPCDHVLCHSCFTNTVNNANLVCPLCRMRISVWCRKATKTNSIVNAKLWELIKTRFPSDVESRLQGVDTVDVETVLPCQPVHQLCQEGDIRTEFEQELRRVEQEDQDRRQEEERKGAALAQQMEQEEVRRAKEAEEQESLGLEAARRMWKEITSTPVSTRKRNRSVLDMLNTTPEPSSSKSPTLSEDLNGYLENENINIFSPDVIEEQRMIELKLKQEKEDAKIARQLQSQTKPEPKISPTFLTPKSRMRNQSGNHSANKENRNQKSLFEFSFSPNSSQTSPSSSQNKMELSKKKPSSLNPLDMLKRKVEIDTNMTISPGCSPSPDLENDRSFAKKLQESLNQENEFATPAATNKNAFSQLIQSAASRVNSTCKMNHKSKACNKCTGCLKENCGKCNPCRDMPRFGGKGVSRQKCVYRKCTKPTKVRCSSCS